jgi:hypothetical protein
LGEWIFNREFVPVQPDVSPSYIMSKTPKAAQRMVSLDDKPNEFPSTPQKFEGVPLTTYHEVLKEGVTFFRNHNGEYVVVKSAFLKIGEHFMC